jgi:hypothetical protein
MEKRTHEKPLVNMLLGAAAACLSVILLWNSVYADGPIVSPDGNGFEGEISDEGSFNSDCDPYDLVDLEDGEVGGNGERSYNTPNCEAGTTGFRGVSGSNWSINGRDYCTIDMRQVDLCTGGAVADGSSGANQYDLTLAGACSNNSRPSSHRNPCDHIVCEGSGCSCDTDNWGYRLRASVGFPGICIDLRPFPVSLVRWDSAARFSCTGSTSGSDGPYYVPNGGGSPADPKEGDWQGLTLVLNLRPVPFAEVNLPYQGTIRLPLVPADSVPYLFKWEVPSHPASGGGPLAGTIQGLEEAPGDMPVFLGSARAPFRLFWQVRYEEYVGIYEEECSTSWEPLIRQNIESCERVLVGYEWQGRGDGGELPPYIVPTSGADINGDGIPEAYWGSNVTVRRMDDNNRIDNPLWRRTWNWGGRIYWGVREGQGQIGWPVGR